ncbi:MAG: helix-turn-helix domain-containing protein [Bacteroidales bacterium]|nr:helix-turn-helix domain-containing protein [Bacteroidales bacterium]
MTAEDIRNARTALAMTQEDMAKALSVTRRTLQNWENGEKIPSTKQVFLREKLKSLLSDIGKPFLLSDEQEEQVIIPKGFVEIMRNLTNAHLEQTKQVTELIELLKTSTYGRKSNEQNS